MARDNGATNGQTQDSSAVSESHDEASPLLQNGQEPSAQETSSPSEEYSRRNLILTALIILLILIMECAGALQMAPLNQVYENVICRNLGVPRDRCGEDTEVQSELALLRGWSVPLDLIPGTSFDVPRACQHQD